MNDTTPVNESSAKAYKTTVLLILLTFLVLLFLPIVLYTHRNSNPSNFKNSSSEKEQPNPERYRLLIEQITAERARLQENYLISTPSEKAAALGQARHILETQMPELMRCWIGTPWDFNGTSQTPGEGKIACGYFVSVILRDAGFKVNRISLAQQASQKIITSIIHSEDKHILTYRKNYDTFIREFRTMEPGIYIIGLDTHVGFLTNFNGEVHFLHSGGKGVADQAPAYARDVRLSKYRVIGCITKFDYVLEKWLLNQDFPTDK